MAKKLAWGIMGTGRIAAALAKAIKASATGELTAVGSRTQAAADKFGQEWQVPKRHGSYEALLADPAVQAVYISLPNHLHMEWAIKCAQAGKHILCEKPLASNFAESMCIVQAAKDHGVFLMEAFMYRCHPQTAKLIELIKSGALGQVQNIHASFGYRMDDYTNIRLRNETAGGGIMDVGCYTMSIARLVAGAAMGRDFCDPAQVNGWGRVGHTGVDEWAAAVALFPGDIVATLQCGARAANENKLRVFGTVGWLEVPSPYFASGSDGGKSSIFVGKWSEKEPVEYVIDEPRGLYTVQVDTVAANLANRQAPSPSMTWDDSLGNMRALDRWRRGMGVTFPCEKPEELAKPFGGTALTPKPGHGMKYGKIAGIDKPISRVLMGSMALSASDMPYTCAMLDDFVRRGGSAIDLAWGYGGGSCERAVGQWMKLRGNREQIVILDKGCHPPFVHPRHLASQISESLERLQTDYIDLYMMHRDDPSIPIGEWVETLNEQKKLGRIRAFGGSNWTAKRLDEANAYAKSKGLTGFAACSNNLALARWNEPLWAGCLSISDPESRAWHSKNQLPNFAWSSQASGFFTGRYKPDDNDPSMEHVRKWWFNDDNFKRLARAQEVGRKKGVDATQIALAYVLNQAFPVFALIGTQTLMETEASMRGVTVELTAQELKYLNLEA